MDRRYAEGVRKLLLLDGQLMVGFAGQALGLHADRELAEEMGHSGARVPLRGADLTKSLDRQMMQ